MECAPLDGSPIKTSPASISARGRSVPLDGADGEAGEIVVGRGVHAGHFGRLAADQRAAGLPAAFGDAGDDRARRGGVELAGGEIVEEEQRLGALGEDVVDAHGHEVDADGGVRPVVDGDLELGAHAVVRGDEDRVVEAGGLQIEQAAETTEVGVRAGTSRRPGQRLDGLDQRLARVDVDAGNAVRRSRSCCAGVLAWPISDLLPIFALMLARCMGA